MINTMVLRVTPHCAFYCQPQLSRWCRWAWVDHHSTWLSFLTVCSTNFCRAVRQIFGGSKNNGRYECHSTGVTRGFNNPWCNLNTWIIIKPQSMTGPNLLKLPIERRWWSMRGAEFSLSIVKHMTHNYQSLMRTLSQHRKKIETWIPRSQTPAILCANYTCVCWKEFPFLLSAMSWR